MDMLHTMRTFARIARRKKVRATGIKVSDMNGFGDTRVGRSKSA